MVVDLWLLRIVQNAKKFFVLLAERERVYVYGGSLMIVRRIVHYARKFFRPACGVCVCVCV